MAYTYSSTPVLSKLRIGDSTYFLKDADVRTILDGFNNAIVTGQITNTLKDEDKFAYSSTIKAYVDSAIAVGLVVEVVNELPTASASTMGKIYMIAQSGGKADDYYNEYITIRYEAEEGTVYDWEQIGDTRIDLSNYYTRTEADNKFAAKADLGALAAVDEASGTLTDYVTGVSSAKVTAAGTVALTDTSTAATLTKGDYTPAGTVEISGTSSTVKVLNADGSVTAGTDASLTAGTLPTKASDAFTANTPTAIDLTKFDGGSKASDTFSAGTLPTYTQGELPSLGTATTASFTTEGVIATVGSGEDEETLIFTTASTASAVTAQGTFDAGTLPTYTQGTLPSFTEGAFTPASLASGFYTAGTAATFTEGSFDAGAFPTLTGGKATTVTLPTFKDAAVLTNASATFTGTTAESILVTGVSYDKATSAAFTGTEVDATVTLTKDNKTVTVTAASEAE